MPKNLLARFEQKNIEAVNAARPASARFDNYCVGDTVVVGTRIAEGNTTRIQNFEGVCLAIYRRGLRTAFRVRKVSAGNEGVEKVFLHYLSSIEYVHVVRRGRVRKAKIYYISKLKGKAARIKEKMVPRKAS